MPRRSAKIMPGLGAPLPRRPALLLEVWIPSSAICTLSGGPRGPRGACSSGGTPRNERTATVGGKEIPNLSRSSSPPSFSTRTRAAAARDHQVARPRAPLEERCGRLGVGTEAAARASTRPPPSSSTPWPSPTRAAPSRRAPQTEPAPDAAVLLEAARRGEGRAPLKWDVAVVGCGVAGRVVLGSGSSLGSDDHGPNSAAGALLAGRSRCCGTHLTIRGAQLGRRLVDLAAERRVEAREAGLAVLVPQGGKDSCGSSFASSTVSPRHRATIGSRSARAGSDNPSQGGLSVWCCQARSRPR